MTKIVFTSLLFFCTVSLFAQNYSEEIKAYREKFKKEIVLEERAPLKVDEVEYLRYYEPDSTYRVTADFTLAVNTVPFDLKTSSGKTKSFKEYGKIKFILQNKPMTLTVYQNMKVIENPEYKDNLFLPFGDPTNGNETYGNGRYIELSIGDIKDNKLVVDFNKAYNPYCAYSDEWNCPRIPPENEFPFSVKAGEMMFAKAHH